MESCLQLSPYYSGRDVFYLTPKKPLSHEVLLFYCVCLKANRFKFNFGRQANSTLEKLLIPSSEEIPRWVADFSLRQYAKVLLSQTSNAQMEEPMKTRTGHADDLIRLDCLFSLINGIASAGLKRFQVRLDSSYVPYVRPSFRQSTSIDAFVSKAAAGPEHVFPKGTLYVSTDGQGSHTYAYVSTFEFVPNSNVCVLEPLTPMSIQEKLFYAECITTNRYRYSYGRKPKGNRLAELMLPAHPPTWVNQFNFGEVVEEFTAVVDRL